MFSFHMLLVPTCICRNANVFSPNRRVTKVPSGGDDDATEGNQAKMLGMMKS